MALPDLKYCPGTLAEGHDTYSRTCLNRVFDGRLVHHVLPYDAPNANDATDDLFQQSTHRISISGVQEKFSVVLDKNKLRLVREGERGTHILKPIPLQGKNRDQMPANEHLTMQVARQVFGIETAENALIFFKDGTIAYITTRFDIKDDGSKWAQDDFASLAGRSPQTHGEDFKYQGNYLELFELMKAYLPAYRIEAPKLFQILVFNYLFSNGDAHFKNFSLLETPLGDYRLSPAYDLLNSRMHVEDSDFALSDGLLPRNLAKGKVGEQFRLLAQHAGILDVQVERILNRLTSQSEKVETMIRACFLSDRFKRNYLQSYQTRLAKLTRG